MKRSTDPKTGPSLLLANIGQLLTLRQPAGRLGPRRGKDLRELGILEDAAVLVVAGKIVSVGFMRDALRDPWLKAHRKKLIEVDCKRKVVLPGFVDSHTHPAFVSPRLVDFESRISGATYEQIAEAGGGIRSSVEGVRSAAKSKLTALVLDRLREMSSFGTTTVEAKSGYGLSLDAEMKSLQAIRSAARQWPGTVVSTLLGAHVVPPEYRESPDEYCELICRRMIPEVAKQKLAAFVDVFCDRGAFDENDMLKLATAAESNGLQVRAHISQLARTPLKRILQLKPVSLDHLDHVYDSDVAGLAGSSTIATLVPGANHFLGLDHFPPARKLIDSGAAVALATDYNPGSSPTPSMPFVLSLACTQMSMTPAEVITAATFNGACALGLQETKGSIEPGKAADMAVFDYSDYREVAYWVAGNHCSHTILNGYVQQNGQTE